MKKLPIYISFFILVMPFKLAAQTDTQITRDKLLENLIESFADDYDENVDLSAIVEELEWYLDHPININTVTRDTLEETQLLNTYQLDNLLAYRKRVGQIFSMNELQFIDGFDKKTIERLSAIASTGPPDEREYMYTHHEINLRTQYTIEKASGFMANENGTKRFNGIEPKLVLKYKGEKDDHWSWAFNAENDSGEPFFSSINKSGFDFYSGSVSWSGKKLIKRLIVGDFNVKMGQGLLFWSGYGSRKSLDVIGQRYTGQGIRPYSSTTEYGFLRGLAIESEYRNISLIAFYSNRNSDANVSKRDEQDRPVEISSFVENGYHRTANEISKKNVINVTTTGLTVRYTLKNISTAINAGLSKFNIPVQPDSQLYNLYYFRGKENFCISADFQCAIKNGTVYGEAAANPSGATAGIAGIDISPASELGISLLLRDYKKDFHSIGGNPFSEFGTVSNEKGAFTALSLLSVPNITLTGYLDLFESYWAKYRTYRPVKGKEFGLQIDWSPTPKIDFQFRYKSEIKNENMTTMGAGKMDVDKRTDRIRLRAEWNPVENFCLRVRSEYSCISKADSLQQGWLFLTEATTKLFDNKLTATGRIAWFNTDNYNSGFHIYESDLPQSYSFPVYYLKGFRYYLTLFYPLSESFIIYLKFAQTLLNKEFDTIGTGDLEINGNHKTEIKLQLRVKF